MPFLHISRYGTCYCAIRKLCEMFSQQDREVSKREKETTCAALGVLKKAPDIRS